MLLFRTSLHRVSSWVTLIALGLMILGIPVLPAWAEGPLDQEARDIAKDLQCPICENNSVADSPSELATQMRGIVRDQLEAGRTRAEIEAYFVARYGEAVLRNPPKEGFNLLVWWVPPAVFLMGAALVVWMLRGALWKAPPAAVEVERDVPDPERARYERLLDEELHERAEGRP